MFETKNKNQIKYIIKKSFWSDIIRSLLRVVDSFLVFLSLRETKQFWGMVYDSVTKQPLDPVIVKLLYTDGREVETCVTDLGGRYGFLAKPGKFKIYSRKTNYAFPSKYVTGDSDGIFKNLYHGEFFELNESSEVVAPNIPMDPVNFDWNQQAKLGVIKNHPYTKLFFKKLVAILFWFGFIFYLLLFVKDFPNVPIYYYVILFSYFIITILATILPEPRLWGKVKILSKNIKPEKLIIELHSTLFAAVSFGKAMVHENGRFLLRAGQGKYTLTISRIENSGEKALLGSVPVKVNRSGVFTSTLIVLS